MEEHISYESFRKRQCDFIVRYTFYTKEQGGRRTGTPVQGYRSDFMYDGDTIQNGIYMIHPEFLDDNGDVIIDKTKGVPSSGKARMWILNDEYFEYHKKRLNIGTKGYFMEVPRKTGECYVIELVRLKQNAL